MFKRVLFALGLIGALVIGWSAFNHTQKTPASTAVVADLRIAELYNRFKEKYGRLRASPEEDSFRMKIFAKNVHTIEQTNKKANGKYTLAINVFADMQEEEIKAKYFGLLGEVNDEKTSAGMKRKSQPMSGRRLLATKRYRPNPDQPEIETRDWAVEDGMHPVYHQQGCASCYAMAAATSMEHLHFRKTNQKVNLSVQQIIDCSNDYGNAGCLGGWMHQVFDYVIESGSLNTADQYPYIAADSELCEPKEEGMVSNLLTNYYRLRKHNATEIKSFLSYDGLVTVGIDVTKLLYYNDGIFDDDNCNNNLNHAVVLVGFGRDATTGQKFWKARNSWGPTWGEEGYFRIARHDMDGIEELCGLSQYVVAPYL